MKIIDEKGKLFGKINLVDLLVILLIIGLLVAAAVKLLGPVFEKAESKEETIGLLEEEDDGLVDIRYTVLCRMVHNDIADYIVDTQVGNMLMSNGTIIDTVVIEDVERGVFYETYVTPQGEPKKTESVEYCDLRFTISGRCPYLLNSYKVGSQEVRVSKSHIVKTVDFEMTGTVMDLEGSGVPMTQAELEELAELEKEKQEQEQKEQEQKEQKKQEGKK